MFLPGPKWHQLHLRRCKKRSHCPLSRSSTFVYQAKGLPKRRLYPRLSTQLCCKTNWGRNHQKLCNFAKGQLGSHSSSDKFHHLEQQRKLVHHIGKCSFKIHLSKSRFDSRSQIYSRFSQISLATTRLFIHQFRHPFWIEELDFHLMLLGYKSSTSAKS